MEEQAKQIIKRVIQKEVVLPIVVAILPYVIVIAVIGFLLIFISAKYLEESQDFTISQNASLFTSDLVDKYRGILQKDERGTYINWYFPIVNGYTVSYVDDFGNSRPNGRTHQGNDLMCDKQIPIIAVESGKIERMGWEQLGGYRIGIRTKDGKYWYYAHMYNEHPYVESLKIGDEVKGGQVIGYVGATGYGSVGTHDVFDPHLHIGVQIGGIWVNPYPALIAIEQNKVNVHKEGTEFTAKKMSKIYINTDLSLSFNDLDTLARKYESGGDVGTIGNIEGDYGGKSYGIYQMATGTSTMDFFLGWLSLKDIKLYTYLNDAKTKDGGYGKNFDDAWTFLASNYKDKFALVQFSFIYETHYLPVVEGIKEKVDITKRSKTLQCVVFSVAIQHGKNGAIGLLNKIDYKKDDKNVINQIYDERSKVDIYFASQTEETKENLIDRFRRERNDALMMLEEELGGG